MLVTNGWLGLDLRMTYTVDRLLENDATYLLKTSSV